jgi:mRNA interferase MazF
VSASPLEWKRGDVVRVRFDPIEGSEQGGTRPALVISPEVINKAGTIVTVAAITSRKLERIYPFEVFLAAGDGGLSRDSKVMLRHLRAIDKARIVGHWGHIEDETMQRVDIALSIAVGLTKL